MVIFAYTVLSLALLAMVLMAILTFVRWRDTGRIGELVFFGLFLAIAAWCITILIDVPETTLEATTHVEEPREISLVKSTDGCYSYRIEEYISRDCHSTKEEAQEWIKKVEEYYRKEAEHKQRKWETIE